MRYLYLLIVITLAACASGINGDSYQAAAEEAAARQAPVGNQGAFHPVPAATPQAPARFDYGKGGCETRYADGTANTCINNKPCNGFGFRDARGALVCACFEVVGGCPENQACNTRRRACVARGEIDLQRGPAR
ncbi:MAG: hypothetical protein JSR23_10990 [Proteobacteria bacterium]|nr:hypothetical protein [Pseudomonadota bacterium]